MNSGPGPVPHASDARPTGAGRQNGNGQAVDGEVGVGGDAGAGERRAVDTVLRLRAGAQGLQRAVGALVRLSDDRQ